MRQALEAQFFTDCDSNAKTRLCHKIHQAKIIKIVGIEARLAAACIVFISGDISASQKIRRPNGSLKKQSGFATCQILADANWDFEIIVGVLKFHTGYGLQWWQILVKTAVTVVLCTQT